MGRSSTRRAKTRLPRSGSGDHSRRPALVASGRFLLRIEPGLHAALREAARADHVSLNEYCARRLAAPAGSLAPRADAVAAVERAASCFGADLLGVVAFGSWARGEAGEESDLDLLLVVDDRVELNRELYRRWDEVQRSGGSATETVIDTHIAHLPDPERFSPGLWGEIAIDGVILFERELVLSFRLAEIRRRIVAGELGRRVAAGGQSYWVDLRPTSQVTAEPDQR